MLNLKNKYPINTFGGETQKEIIALLMAELKKPISKEDPVVERNITLLRKRSAVGIKKYGTTLHDNLTDDFIKHALEEVLDLANYLQAHLMRKEKPSKRSE